MDSKAQIEDVISGMIADETVTEYNSVAKRLLEKNKAKDIVSVLLNYISIKKKESSRVRTRDGRHPKSGTRDRRSNRERARSRPSDGETKGRTEFGRRSAGPKKPIRRSFKRVARKPVRPAKR